MGAGGRRDREFGELAGEVCMRPYPVILDSVGDSLIAHVSKNHKSTKVNSEMGAESRPWICPDCSDRHAWAPTA